jgi:hypothetical protein
MAIDFKEFGANLNVLLQPYNYMVAATAAAGRPGKGDRTMREFRLQLINKSNNTSQRLINGIVDLVKNNVVGSTNIKFNDISPNSSKFSSCSFVFTDQKFDLVVAQGANRGEKFEGKVVTDLQKYFLNGLSDKAYKDLLDKMNAAYPAFANVEIARVEQKKGATRKTGVPVEKLGEIIGDIVLTDTTGKKWYISLKDVNGATVSALPGAASLFNNQGDIQPNSEGANLLKVFGVDLNKVQAGFDERRNFKKIRQKLPTTNSNQSKMKDVFRTVWGMNYFYVRKTTSSWEVFWIDNQKLDKLSDVKVDGVRYPGKNSKSINIDLVSPLKKYLIEVRNSKAGEYPNDIKVRIK